MPNPMRKAVSRTPRQKSVTPGQLMGLGATGVPQWREWSTETAVREGYKASHWIYAAISQIASAVASVPWVAVQGEGDDREDLEDHPLTRLLESPNPYVAGSEMMERLTAHMYLGGNACLTKIRPRRGGAPEELWSVMPDRVSPVPAQRGFLEYYEACAADGRRLPDIKPKDMCHLMFVDPANDYWGLSPLQAVARQVDTDVEAMRWNKVSLEHKAVPDGILSTEGTLDDEQYERMREQVRAKSGSDNAREALILEAGLGWQQMSLSPAEMDFIESRKMTREDILAVFGVPPAKLGIVQSATQSDVEAMRSQFWQDTVVPFLRKIETGFNLHLAPEYGPDVSVRPILTEVQELKSAYQDRILDASRLFYMGVPVAEINRVLELGLDESALPTGKESFVPSEVVSAEQTSGEDDVIGRILGLPERNGSERSERNGHE